MAAKRKISTAERKHQDYLRKKGLKVGETYEKRLMAARRKEVKRVLDLSLNYDSAEAVAVCIKSYLNESSYLPAWFDGLYLNAGLPMAKSTARDLRAAKADAFSESDIWLSTLRDYAANRAGSEISVVSGTLKDSLVKLIRDLMSEDAGLGVEKLTKKIYQEYKDKLEKWQVRRIAQTETMIAMGDSADLAARTLDLPFTKQWCISGLGNTRESHEVMDGTTVDQDDPFVLAGGMMMYPHDTSMNAAASEIINCACCCIRRPKSASVSPSQPTVPAAPSVPSPAVPTVPPPTVPVSTVPAPAAVKPVKPAKRKPAAVATEAETEARIQAMMKELSSDLPEETRKAIALNNLEIEKALKITKGAPMSVEMADEGHANPNLNKAKSYKVNCQTCSPTYLMRTRGFDVTAGPNTKREGNLSYYLSSHNWEKYLNADGTKATHISLQSWAKSEKLSKLTAKDYLRFYDESTKEKGIYEVSVCWDGGRSGHSTLLQRFADGKLKRIDAQVWTQEVLTAADDICAEANMNLSYIGPGRGVMRIDDKIIDVKYAKIFKKVKK